LPGVVEAVLVAITLEALEAVLVAINQELLP
jgi:hypothetical protein